MLNIFTLPQDQRAAAVRLNDYAAVRYAIGDNLVLLKTIIRYLPQQDIESAFTARNFMAIRFACSTNAATFKYVATLVSTDTIANGVTHYDFKALTGASKSGSLELFTEVTRYIPLSQIAEAIQAQDYAALKGASGKNYNAALFEYIISLLPGGLATVFATHAHSIISSAAEGGNANLFMRMVRDTENAQTVLETDNYSILSSAARGGDMAIFNYITSHAPKPVATIIAEHNYAEIADAAKSGSTALFAHVINLIPAESIAIAVAAQDYHAVINAAASGNLALFTHVVNLVSEKERGVAIAAQKYQAVINAAESGNLALFKYIQCLIPEQIKAAITAPHAGFDYGAARGASYSTNPLLLKHIFGLMPEHVTEAIAVANYDMLTIAGDNPLIAHVVLAHMLVDHQLAIMQAIHSPIVISMAKELCGKGSYAKQDMVKALNKAYAIVEYFKALTDIAKAPALFSHHSHISRTINSFHYVGNRHYPYVAQMLTCPEQRTLATIHQMLPPLHSILFSQYNTAEVKALTMIRRFMYMMSAFSPPLQVFFQSTPVLPLMPLTAMSTLSAASPVLPPDALMPIPISLSPLLPLILPPSLSKDSRSMPVDLLPYNQVRFVLHFPARILASSFRLSLPEASIAPELQSLPLLLLPPIATVESITVARDRQLKVRSHLDAAVATVRTESLVTASIGQARRFALRYEKMEPKITTEVRSNITVACMISIKYDKPVLNDNARYGGQILKEARRVGGIQLVSSLMEEDVTRKRTASRLLEYTDSSGRVLFRFDTLDGIGHGGDVLRLQPVETAQSIAARESSTDPFYIQFIEVIKSLRSIFDPSQLSGTIMHLIQQVVDSVHPAIQTDSQTARLGFLFELLENVRTADPLMPYHFPGKPDGDPDDWGNFGNSFAKTADVNDMQPAPHDSNFTNSSARDIQIAGGSHDLL